MLCGGVEVTKLMVSCLGMFMVEVEVLKCWVGFIWGEGLEIVDVVKEVLQLFVVEICGLFNYFV